VPLSIRIFILTFLAVVSLSGQSAEAGRKRFAALCSGCHGAGGTGGERGPALFGREESRVHSAKDVRDIIRNGIPSAGMPAFRLADAEVEDLAAYIHGLRAPAVENPTPGDVAAGEQFFFGKGNCGACHTVNGLGGWIGPDLSALGKRRSLSEIESALKDPSRRITPGYRVATVRLNDGSSLRGLVKNENTFNLQLQGLDGRLHLLARNEIAGVDREKNSLMPPVEASEAEMRDLVAYISRLAGGAPGNSIAGTPPLPGAVPSSRSPLRKRVTGPHTMAY